MIQKADHAQQGRLCKVNGKVNGKVNFNTHAQSHAVDLKHRHPSRSWFACPWRTMIWKGAGKR